jgi:hypothetical protein
VAAGAGVRIRSGFGWAAARRRTVDGVATARTDLDAWRVPVPGAVQHGSEDDGTQSMSREVE